MTVVKAPTVSLETIETRDCAIKPFPRPQVPAGAKEQMAEAGLPFLTATEEETGVPGFAGLYLKDRPDGTTAFVYMTDPAQQAQAEEAARKVLGPERFAKVRSIVVLPGEYSVFELQSWYDCLWHTPGFFDAASWSGVSERHKRVSLNFRPRPGLRARIEDALAAAHVPMEAVDLHIGCPVAKPYEPPQPDASIADVAPLIGALEVKVRAPEQAQAGRTVRFTLAVKNTSPRVQEVMFGVGHDIAVTTPDGTLVWNAGCERTFVPDVGMTLTLQSGQEEHLFTAEGMQWDNQGDDIPPGEYLVYGVFDIQGGWASPPVAMRVTL
jgi:hypothetical protein